MHTTPATAQRKTALRLTTTGLGLAALLLLGLAAAPAAQAQTYTLNTLANFNGSNGKNPVADLTLIGSTLYGTTLGGGANNDGTVFSVPISGGALTTLASFNGNNGQNPTGGGGLTLIGDALYGTTRGGSAGTNGGGTVFSVPLTGGALTTLASFSSNGSNGYSSGGGLTLLGSTLYGVTASGGASNNGTVYSIPVSGGTPTTLATFNDSNGRTPLSRLTLVGSTLYGTTYYGGDGSGYSRDGTVFSVPVGGGTPTTLFSFDGSNGYGPAAGLTLSADGTTLYGATSGASVGSADRNGIVFSIPVGGGALTTLASFNGSNGQSPIGNLTLSADGKLLYGTTELGGAGDGSGYSRDGTVFSVPVGGGTPTTLFSFNGSNGYSPQAGLTLGSDGTLYGTTSGGGAGSVNGGGIVFSLTPNAAPVPEASSVVSFGLLLLGGLGGAALRARRRSAAG